LLFHNFESFDRSDGNNSLFNHLLSFTLSGYLQHFLMGELH
jgi:hypothetical protein